jgi:ERCC4-type nuclease
VFERKTLADQAASIRDGRHDNKQKMMDLRAQLGCDVYYIIESDKVYSDESMINGLPYKTIRASVMHLMVRDRIFVVNTRTPRDTVKLMCDMVAYYNKYKPAEAAPPESSGGRGVMALTEDIKDLKTLRAMWCAVPGISDTICDQFLKYRIIDVFAKNADALKNIDNIRYASGRKLPRTVYEELANVSRVTMVRIMAVVRGITPDAAAAICDAVTDWNACTADQISSLKANGKKTGVYGANLYRLITWGAGREATIPP